MNFERQAIRDSRQCGVEYTENAYAISITKQNKKRWSIVSTAHQMG